MFRGKLFRQLLIALVCFAILRWWALLILIAMLAWSAYSTPRTARSVNWSITDRLFLYRSGWLRKVFLLSWLNKVQVLATTEGYFDRRTGMAALHVDTSGGGASVAFLPAEVARATKSELYARAAGSPFRL
jgi:membrane protein YdbS with pleckstrin-like domain